MSRLQSQYTCHHELELSAAQMVRASHRRSEAYGFDSRQGRRRFSEIQLDTHAHTYKLPHSQITLLTC